MSRHLLLVTLGPVQDFIAQARRTRDLWFGSHLLSEISRAAAAKLAGGKARLVFPALDPSMDADAKELLPSDGPLRSTGEPALAIPNKLLCEVPESVDPATLARGAMAAAEERWLQFAADVKRRCGGLLAPGTEAVWEEQLQTFLELSAAWTELPTGDGEYAKARADLEREMAGRKLLRTFSKWEHQRGGVPKSSLDGARETVIREPAGRPANLVKRYRITGGITNGEQLDAVGLVKRAGGEPGQFVPIANIALAPWIAAARERFPGLMKGVEKVCREEGFSRVDRPDLGCGRLFGFDAEVFLEDRWAAMLTEAGGGPTGDRARPDGATRAREWAKRVGLTTLLDGMGAPFPYVACLVADGDHMGRALDKVSEVGAHRRFSTRLSGFAGHARTIIEQDHKGVLVYAGGDDVLAFVNVSEALACAEELRVSFNRLVQEALSDAAVDVPVPTLSVGLGFGHLLESLGQLRRLGGQAEKLAKRQRNALGIVIEKRSGGTTTFSESWSHAPVARLGSAVSLLRHRRLSTKKIHEIGAELERLPTRGTLLAGEQEDWEVLLRAEVTRILARSGEGDGLGPGEAGLAFPPGANYDARHSEVEQWVSGMLVAKLVAEATTAAEPSGEPTADAARLEERG